VPDTNLKGRGGCVRMRQSGDGLIPWKWKKKQKETILNIQKRKIYKKKTTTGRIKPLY